MRNPNTGWPEGQSEWALTDDARFHDDITRGGLLPGNEPLPELDELLHNSIVHVTEQPEEDSRDVLKALEKEYRQALIWGIQKSQSRQSAPLKLHRFSENSFDFDRLKAQVESATVTHCIFDSATLINKVFSEMEINEEDVLRPDPSEKKDVLSLLANEERGHDTRKRLPDLLVQEIYQAGLDTLF